MKHAQICTIGVCNYQSNSHHTPTLGALEPQYRLSVTTGVGWRLKTNVPYKHTYYKLGTSSQHAT